MTARRRTRAIDRIGVSLLSAVLLVWTLLPIYNIIRVSMQEKEEVLSTSVYPIAPSSHAFSVVFRQAFWLLETFWNQMGNSFYIGIVVAFLVLAIGSLTSFTISRMRIRSGWMLTNAALLTYVIPLSFLAIPFYSIMGKYGLTNNPLAVIAVEVTFATPYAIFIFQQYGASIPLELDEAARIDGASTWGVVLFIVLPLLRPIVAASAVLAFIYSWNEFLFGLMLTTSVAVPVTVGASFFFSASGGGVQWGVAAAVMILSVAPPLLLGLAAYRHIGRSMTAGAIKG
jgi:multiple sugar transport system permease protein